jgi:DNA-binding NtrC family response regulator
MLFHESDINNYPVKKSASGRLEREPNSRQRILVIEDDPDIRRLNTEVLIYSGYQVDAANGGIAAWYALQQNNYDLVVTDNKMPKGSGEELLKKLQAEHMSIPVIMATGTHPSAECLEAHIVPIKVLLKPYDIEDLLRIVKNTLYENTKHSPAPTPPPNWQAEYFPTYLSQVPRASMAA